MRRHGVYFFDREKDVWMTDEIKRLREIETEFNSKKSEMSSLREVKRLIAKDLEAQKKKCSELTKELNDLKKSEGPDKEFMSKLSENISYLKYPIGELNDKFTALENQMKELYSKKLLQKATSEPSVPEFSTPIIR